MHFEGIDVKASGSEVKHDPSMAWRVMTAWLRVLCVSLLSHKHVVTLQRLNSHLWIILYCFEQGYGFSCNKGIFDNQHWWTNSQTSLYTLSAIHMWSFSIPIIKTSVPVHTTDLAFTATDGQNILIWHVVK